MFLIIASARGFASRLQREPSPGGRAGGGRRSSGAGAMLGGMSSFAFFNPLVAGWFAERFGAPTEAQREAGPRSPPARTRSSPRRPARARRWPRSCACLDRLVRAARARRPLEDRTYGRLRLAAQGAVATTSAKNLERPLAGAARARRRRRASAARRSASRVRTGDTPAARARRRMRATPPHILVTTPESLYILLTARARPRRRWRGVRDRRSSTRSTPLAGDKRGAHLALSLERLDALVAASRPRPAHRPVGDAEADRAGRARSRCAGARAGRCRRSSTSATGATLDLAIEMPDDELGAVCTHEQWAEIYDRIAALVARAPHDARLRQHAAAGRARRAHLARAARRGRGRRAPRQPCRGSVRLDAEQRLKAGELRGRGRDRVARARHRHRRVDLVCQIGSPRAIATFLQRVGRSGHCARRDVPRGVSSR